MPTAPRQWGSAQKDFHRTLPPGSVEVHSESHYPQPQGSGAVYRRIHTAHCPLQCGSALKVLSSPSAGLINGQSGPRGTKAWA